MKSKQAKRVYWGVVLIAVAVFTLLKCTGVDIGFVGTLSITDLILGAIVLSIAIGSIVRRNYWALPFELAVLFMLFEKEIARASGAAGDNLMNNWLLLGCALLVSIGLSMIFPDTLRKHTEIVCTDGGTGEKGTRFGSETKYIDCTNFRNYTYNVRMGDGSVYFENIEHYQGGGVLNVTCKMGDMTIHVPSQWHLVAHIESSLGSVDVPGSGSVDGPELTVNGYNKMGEIKVVFC